MFEGEVKSLPLAGVLGTIARGSLTGTLSLANGREEWRAAFSDGFVVAFVSSRHEPPLLDRLVGRGLVGAAEAEKVRSSPLATRQSLRSLLVSRGYMKEDAFRDAVTREVVEGLVELFFDTTLAFRFEDGNANLGSGPWNRDQVSAGLRIATAAVVLEGTRRLDEWARLRGALGALDAVVVAAGEVRPDDTAVVLAALERAREARALGEILESLEGPRLERAEALVRLLREGRLARRPSVVAEPVVEARPEAEGPASALAASSS